MKIMPRIEKALKYDDYQERIQDIFVGLKCPECGLGKFEQPLSGQTSYVICGECESIQLLYFPQSYQDDYHKDSHWIKGFFGGFGSGKSRTNVEEVTLHICNTPNGMSLMGAATFPQLEQTAMKDFFEYFPDDLIETYHKQKNVVVCKNGHVVLFRPLDDEGKIRSLNLTLFFIEEASEVKYDIFVQLQTRLRNTATSHHQGLLGSNPDLGWIRSDFLMVSDKIHNAATEYLQEKEEINPDFSSHIAPTRLNRYLKPTPDKWAEKQARGKPEWWRKRFLEGSFEHTEGQVYPKFASAIVDWKEHQPIPKHWMRLFGVDFGLRDPTAALVAAIDPRLGDVHIYREHLQSEWSVRQHAVKFDEMLEDVPQGRILRMVADPAGKKRNEKDMKSYFDWYAEYNYFFDPGINKLEDGIMKVFTYFEMGRLKIHSNCVETIKEGINYKYPEKKLDDKKNAGDKPIDKDNHLMDALRYILAELPNDPNDLINHGASPHEFQRGYVQDQSHLPHALRDDDYDYGANDWYGYV